MAKKPPTEQQLFKEALNRTVGDAAKVNKALKMLRADRFQLYVDADEEQIVGVVKSQNDPSLVYSCRITHEGEYSCCTQNLNVCGGLRGSVCKHILVLTIGLVQGKALSSAAALAWLKATGTKRAVLDKDAAGEVFIKYKGAEAGEVDWRPTETLPEDFYAF
ncbi:MAG: hypothetical protein KC621_26160 [Myxococcales bacterium]|nr:hypothetical protein [Myxococcales bacterium]